MVWWVTLESGCCLLQFVHSIIMICAFRVVTDSARWVYWFYLMNQNEEKLAAKRIPGSNRKLNKDQETEA